MSQESDIDERVSEIIAAGVKGGGWSDEMLQELHHLMFDRVRLMTPRLAR